MVILHHTDSPSIGDSHLGQSGLDSPLLPQSGVLAAGIKSVPRVRAKKIGVAIIIDARLRTEDAALRAPANRAVHIVLPKEIPRHVAGCCRLCRLMPPAGEADGLHVS